jgi:excisionase family DNA binding protein
MVIWPFIHDRSGKKEELMLIDQILEQKKSALRANDIARVLDLSEKQIYKMAAAGEIPSLRIANSVRFDPHDFAEWLRTRSSAPEIEPKARVLAPRSRPKLDRSARHDREI